MQNTGVPKYKENSTDRKKHTHLKARKILSKTSKSKKGVTKTTT